MTPPPGSLPFLDWLRKQLFPSHLFLKSSVPLLSAVIRIWDFVLFVFVMLASPHQDRRALAISPAHLGIHLDMSQSYRACTKLGEVDGETQLDSTGALHLVFVLS